MPMTHNFTPNDLIRFIYRETSPEEDIDIRQWVLEDESAANLFQQLVESKQSLDIEAMEPSETSINIILEYDRQMSGEHVMPE